MSQEEAVGAGSGAISGAETGTQILPGWGTLIGGVLGAGVGAIGGAGVHSANVAKQNAMNDYMSQLQGLDMPRYEDLKLAFQRYSSGQQLTPTQLTALQDADSQITKLTQDKAAKSAQLEALAGLTRNRSISIWRSKSNSSKYASSRIWRFWTRTRC